jgi:hypothetical protein
MVTLCDRIRQLTAARRVCSCEIDCPPLEPTPSPSELAIRSGLRWRASAIAPTAVTAAGTRTGNKTIKTTTAIENMGVLSFLRKADRLIFVKQVAENPLGTRNSDEGSRRTGSSIMPSRVLPFPDTFLSFPDAGHAARRGINRTAVRLLCEARAARGQASRGEREQHEEGDAE